MDIREFIKESVCQIMTGIEETNLALKSYKPGSPVVAPRYEYIKGTGRRVYGCHEMPEREVSHIEFDIAVEVSRSETMSRSEEGGAKFAALHVASAEVGAQRNKEQANERSTISRIRFSLPVVFPYTPDLAELAAKAREAEE